MGDDFEGSSDTQTINLGFDSLNSISGNIFKNNNNNYYISLSWNTPNQIPDDIELKKLFSPKLGLMTKALARLLPYMPI